jgi:hypothetical protein
LAWGPLRRLVDVAASADCRAASADRATCVSADRAVDAAGCCVAWARACGASCIIWARAHEDHGSHLVHDRRHRRRAHARARALLLLHAHARTDQARNGKPGGAGVRGLRVVCGRLRRRGWLWRGPLRRVCAWTLRLPLLLLLRGTWLLLLLLLLRGR